MPLSAKPVIPANRRASSIKGSNFKKGEEKKLKLQAHKKTVKEADHSGKMLFVALFVLAMLVLELFTSAR
jgi:hypothetical protein